VSTCGGSLAASSEAGKEPGTKTQVLEIYPSRAIAGYHFDLNNHRAGWGLRLRGRRFQMEPEQVTQSAQASPAGTP
jgi:hypothetical protein